MGKWYGNANVIVGTLQKLQLVHYEQEILEVAVVCINKSDLLNIKNNGPVAKGRRHGTANAWLSVWIRSGPPN